MGDSVNKDSCVTVWQSLVGPEALKDFVLLRASSVRASSSLPDLQVSTLSLLISRGYCSWLMVWCQSE